MLIGIDLQELQGASVVRGVGEVTIQLVNHLLPLFAEDERVNTVIFYLYEDNFQSALKLIEIPSELNYEIKFYNENAQNRHKLSRIKNVFIPLPEKSLFEIDAFLNFSNFGYVPKAKNSFMVWYDIISYVGFENTVKKQSKFPFNIIKKNRLLIKLGKNYMKLRIKTVAQRAQHVIAISHSAKSDLLMLVPKLKGTIDVVPLGVTQADTCNENQENGVLPSEPYLLFLGGIDARREIASLVKQFEILRSRGFNFKLVLAGKAFETVEKISVPEVKNAILNSVFKHDIVTLGYISNSFKTSLYNHAFAFVYPTLYEGFGLPVLEGMLARTLVLTYDNSSLPEVGGEHVFYVHQSSEIADKLEEMISLSVNDRNAWLDASQLHAKQFTWEKAAHQYFDLIMNNEGLDNADWD
jgi:glycosyltransferase involved in cell wall biosynthesis